MKEKINLGRNKEERQKKRELLREKIENSSPSENLLEKLKQHFKTR